MEQEDDQVCSSWGNVHVVSPRAAPIVVQEAGHVRTPDETVSLPETLSEEPEDSPIAIVSVQELGGSEWAIELDLRLNAAQARYKSRLISSALKQRSPLFLFLVCTLPPW